MRRASTHSALRMIVSIVGLNSLVMVAWLILQDVVGPAGSLSAGPPDSPVQPRADGPESAGLWLEWLLMLAIFGALLVIIARRIWGPVGMSAQSGEPLDDASLPHDEAVASQPVGSTSPTRSSSGQVEAYAARSS